MYSGQFCARMATRSPRWTPRRMSAFARRKALPQNSAWVIVRPSNITAGAAGRSSRFRTVRSPRVSISLEPRSFQLGSGLLNDLLPTGNLLAQKGREFLRRAADRVDPHFRYLRDEFGILECTSDFEIELLDDVGGRSLGDDESDPGGDVEAAQSRFIERRDVGGDCRPAQAGHRQ